MPTTDDSWLWDLPDAVVTEILGDRRCRLLLEILATAGPLPVLRLARRVAAAEAETDPTIVSERDIQAVYDALCDQYIPRLSAVALVEYNPQHASLRLSETGERVLIGA